MVVLGPVVFQAFEVPETIRFGGKQRTVVHLLPGGGRVVDAMGADEGPVSWNGVFSGPDAGARARVLDRLRRDGAAVPLAWDGWRYTVVIESLQVEQANPAWMPYSLRACVVAVGDVVVAEADPSWDADDASALGAGPTLDGDIAAATAGIAATDVATSIAAAGQLARLVQARAYLGEAAGESLL